MRTTWANRILQNARLSTGSFFPVIYVELQMATYLSFIFEVVKNLPELCAASIGACFQ